LADLSALGTLNPVETLDLTDGIYEDAQQSAFRLPEAGTYTVIAPDSFPSTAFTRTKAGALSIDISPTIVGPKNEGFKTRFIKVSAKTFDRKGKKVSQLGDYLRATGFQGILRDEQDQADAVEQTAGKTYTMKLDWSAYHGPTGFRLEGMTKFPKNEDGTYQSWVNHPTEKDPETGAPIRVRANLALPFNGLVPAEG
jgi:hypothetical protein